MTPSASKSRYYGGRWLAFHDLTTSAPIPDKVDFKDDFTLNWEISFDSGQTWSSASSSTQKLYQTLGASQTSEMFETVVWLGSKFGAGATSAATLVPLVWANFASRQVTTVAGKALWYYRPNVPTRATTTVLLIVDGTGECGAWADLFANVLKAQGIEGIKAHSIVANPALKPANATGLGLLVREWTFVGEPKNWGYGVEFGYRINLEAFEAIGIAGQGPNPDPRSRFPNHQVVSYANTIYDPSYGKQLASTRAWENEALAGVFVPMPNPQQENYPLGVVKPRKQENQNEDWTVFNPPFNP